jgi:Ca2+-binding RTX toxin-like protein
VFAIDGFTIGNPGYLTLFQELTATFFSNIENVVGSAHDDKIFGNDADNVIEGGGGADVIDGRGGTDTVSYAHSAQGIDINLAGAGGLEFGLGAGGDATGDFLLNIENVIGSSYSDTFIGSRHDNVFTGGNGADTFVFDRNIGHDTITDFQAKGTNHDVIRFNGVFQDFEDLLSHADDRGRDVVITIDGQNSVTLENVDLRDLQAADFYFV